MRRYDLSQLTWTLKGYSPNGWRSFDDLTLDPRMVPEVDAVPARVPGSVQQGLLEAGIIPDWNVGLNYRLCQWVEHLDWVFEAQIPDEWLADGRLIRLACLGLDYQGEVYVNSTLVGSFCGTVTPHAFDLSQFAGTSGNRLSIVFQRHPDWLGQFGFTSQIREWKPRFYYSWDWIVRLVQIGIWDTVTIEATSEATIERLDVTTDADVRTSQGSLWYRGTIAGDSVGHAIRVTVHGTTGTVFSDTVSADEFERGIPRDRLDVGLWWPNGHGEQPLYTLRCELLDPQGRCVDERTRTIGFKHVDWKPCEDAPAGADPWLCCVNGRPIFLQGVNWTPIRPNFGDVSVGEVRKRLELYKGLGLNVVRVWGGAVLERESFYALCDALGIMVWQEFPLSSSGFDNWPPEDEATIEGLCRIAESYVERRRHHVSLLMWCGGNELQGSLDGGKVGRGKPVDLTHPLMQRLAGLMGRLDPGRRFIPTSPLGPRSFADAAEFGRGLHWATHGPWKIPGDYRTTWLEYWERDDSLFRSEFGCPGASPVALMEQYKGECELLPVALSNPIWARTSWWIEEQAFEAERGRKPLTIEEYVAWSQERQRKALEHAVRVTKARFPRVGGVILWMGHDCFPCAANTSIVDFAGNPKPAALAVGEVFRRTA